jgi:hypothetical protein
MTTLQQASSSRKHFEVGYALYLAGLKITHCQSADQRRGWLAANAAEGEYVTPGYAQNRGW